MLTLTSTQAAVGKKSGIQSSMSLFKQVFCVLSVLCTSFWKNLCHGCSVSPLCPGGSWSERYPPAVARQRECTGAGKEPVPKICLLFRRRQNDESSVSFSHSVLSPATHPSYLVFSLSGSVFYFIVEFCGISYTALDFVKTHTCWTIFDDCAF